MKLEVTHDRFPKNEVIINGVWCDIGSHMAHSEEMANGQYDASVCQECYDHYTDKWN